MHSIATLKGVISHIKKFLTASSKKKGNEEIKVIEGKYSKILQQKNDKFLSYV